MSAPEPEIWRRLLGRRPADAGLSALYGPSIAEPVTPDGCFVLGRIAQSLDGRIATASRRVAMDQRARRTSCTRTGCARSAMRSWSAPARCARTIRS